MKLIVVLFAVLLNVQAITDKEVQRQWNEYRQRYQKIYRSPVEERRRFNIFKHHLEDIEANNELFNEGKVNYKKGVNEFTDWTDEEFKEYVSHGLINKNSMISTITDETGVIQQAWTLFKTTYKKSYRSPVASKKRFEIFKNNYVKMMEHNDLFDQGLVSDRLGINQFSDWTQEEFRDFVNKGLIPTDDDDDIVMRWEDFQVEFNKHYNSIEESEKRFNIFKRNVRDIDEHNRLYEEGKSTYMMGINQFTDWTNEEYQEWVRTH